MSLFYSHFSSRKPVYNKNYLTREDLLRCYLPFAASGTGSVDNAKVSVVVEGLLRLLWRNDLLFEDFEEQDQNRKRRSGADIKKQQKLELKEAVEKGIRARKDRIGPESKKRKAGSAVDEEDDLARKTLEASSNRMLALVDIL